jgi:hypothetical protein
MNITEYLAPILTALAFITFILGWSAFIAHKGGFDNLF